MKECGYKVHNKIIPNLYEMGYYDINNLDDITGKYTNREEVIKMYNSLKLTNEDVVYLHRHYVVGLPFEYLLKKYDIENEYILNHILRDYMGSAIYNSRAYKYEDPIIPEHWILNNEEYNQYLVDVQYIKKCFDDLDDFDKF